jgi:hypothetical protein
MFFLSVTIFPQPSLSITGKKKASFLLFYRSNVEVWKITGGETVKLIKMYIIEVLNIETAERLRIVDLKE